MANVVLRVEDFESLYVRPKPGRVLVVGSLVYVKAKRTDRRLRYKNAIGVDMMAGLGVDRVLDLEEPLPDDLGTFSHIDCISVLEHSRRPWLLAANIERMLEPSSTLYVQVPFVWRVHSYPSDYWRFTVEGVKNLFPAIEWQAIQFVHGLPDGTSVPKLAHDELVYFAKTQVCGFGGLG